MVGVIPYAAEPQVYDPPGHVVATANQRPVGPSYPYYIGTSADFLDNSSAPTRSTPPCAVAPD